MKGRLAGWQAGRLAGWQAGRLASWLALQIIIDLFLIPIVVNCMRPFTKLDCFIDLDKIVNIDETLRSCWGSAVKRE
jgi:hypothetical protein